MAKLNLMAYDLGASSGRAMLGEFDGKKIEISELHRFLNEPVQLCRRFCWDIQREFFEMKAGLLKASARASRSTASASTPGAWTLDCSTKTAT